MDSAPIPRLIIVDGLSGSGKTTACLRIEQRLREQGVPVTAYYEADVPHPLHWWRYWDGKRHLAPDFEHTAPEQYISASLARWQSFAQQIAASDSIFLVEGALYCLALGFFMQGDFATAQLEAYVTQVEQIIRPLDPLLIYLRQRDVTTHTPLVWQRRGAALRQELVSNLAKTPAMRRRGMHSFAGIVTLWQEVQQQTDQVFTQHAIRKLLVEVSDERWQECDAQIDATLFEGADGGKAW